jgi:hypothetical protein
MKYQAEHYNDVLQRAQAAVVHLQAQPLVNTCAMELQSIIKKHTIQEAAIWILAIQQTQGVLMRSALDIKDVEVVQ